MSACRAALAVALLVLPTPALGQAPPASLGRVDSLVVAGRTEEARIELTTWWGASAAVASRADAQRALWLRALLTVDPGQAGVDYQRLVVEYPGGAYSDRALLRLAQLAEASGDPARARERLRTLVRDYPASPYRLEAGRLLEEVEDAAALAAAAGPSTAPSAPGPPAAPAAGTGTAGTWTVQVGAFASVVRARSLRDAVIAEGLDARLVQLPGSPLVRVRSGRFATEAEAQRLEDALAGRGFEATVAGDVLREEAVP